MEQIATSVYEQMEAKMDKNIKDAEAARLTTTDCTEEKETKKMFKVYETITLKTMQTVFSKAADTGLTPVDLGFKLNNLTEEDFRIYAEKLMNMEAPKLEYPTPEDRNAVFYKLYDLNKHMAVTRPIPVQPPKRDYHIPTDTEISLRNDSDWKDLEIEHLKARLAKATECYIALRDFSTYCIDEYLEAGKQTRKGSDVIVK